jgi:hypothetical protein
MISSLFRAGRLLAIGGVLGLAAACHQNSSVDAGLASFNKDSLTDAIRILSSDSFQGR